MTGEQRLKKPNRSGDQKGLIPAGDLFFHLLRQPGLAVIFHDLGDDLPVHMGALFNQAQERQYHNNPALSGMLAVTQRKMKQRQRFPRTRGSSQSK